MELTVRLELEMALQNIMLTELAGFAKAMRGENIYCFPSVPHLQMSECMDWGYTCSKKIPENFGGGGKENFKFLPK